MLLPFKSAAFPNAAALAFAELFFLDTEKHDFFFVGVGQNIKSGIDKVCNIVRDSQLDLSHNK